MVPRYRTIVAPQDLIVVHQNERKWAC
uniref:Uncharacterized protein n=1 Tax=Arundo donax TaxID=35708 RepID=A0A0A8ZYQ1_ARUDO